MPKHTHKRRTDSDYKKCLQVQEFMFIIFSKYTNKYLNDSRLPSTGGMLCLTAIGVGNRIGDQSSNPGQGNLYIASP